MKPFETITDPATPERKKEEEESVEELLPQAPSGPEEEPVADREISPSDNFDLEESISPEENPKENIVPDKDAEPVATASPDGSLDVNAAALEGMMPVAEAEQKIHEAYLRGRKEAVEAHWDTPAQGHAAPGVASDPSLSLFQLRKSVWG